MTARWLGIPGTWGAKNEGKWWLSDSPLSQYLNKLGLRPLRSEPFVWSTNLNGFFPSFTSRHSDWDAAGAALSYYLLHTRKEDRNLIAHSHGLQAVLYACGKYGVELNSLISVGSPVRKDMEEMAAKAAPKIGYWTHVHSDRSDKMQWLGSLFDGRFDVFKAQRKHPLANLNVMVPKVGHSQILHEPQLFSYWDALVYPMFKANGN